MYKLVELTHMYIVKRPRVPAHVRNVHVHIPLSCGVLNLLIHLMYCTCTVHVHVSALSLAAVPEALGFWPQTQSPFQTGGLGSQSWD